MFPRVSNEAHMLSDSQTDKGFFQAQGGMQEHRLIDYKT
jgi:hypothetical protein